MKRQQIHAKGPKQNIEANNLNISEKGQHDTLRWIFIPFHSWYHYLLVRNFSTRRMKYIFQLPSPNLQFLICGPPWKLQASISLSVWLQNNNNFDDHDRHKFGRQTTLYATKVEIMFIGTCIYHKRSKVFGLLGLVRRISK